MLKHLRFFLLVIISFSFLGCAREIGRIKFRDINTKGIDFKHTGYNSLGTNEILLDIKKGKRITFWTDVNVEFEGNLDIVYNLDIIIGDSIYTFGLTPMKDLSIEMKEIKLTLGNKTKWSYIAKMYGNFDSKVSGKLKLKAVLASNPNNNARIKMADIVFKEK